MLANVPVPIKAKLEAAMRNVLSDSDIKQKFSALGVDPGDRYGSSFKDFVNSEIDKWGEVVKKAGVELQQQQYEQELKECR